MFPFQEVRDTLRQVDNNHHRVNWGGCACVAVMLAEHLQPMLSEMKIVSCGYGENDIDVIREDFSPECKDDWYDGGVYFHHVWVEGLIDNTWYAFDSDGIHDLEDMYDKWGKPYGGSFALDEMRTCAGEDTWNSAFDREQLPSIQTTLDVGFEDLSI